MFFSLLSYLPFWSYDLSFSSFDLDFLSVSSFIQPKMVAGQIQPPSPCLKAVCPNAEGSLVSL